MMTDRWHDHHCPVQQAEVARTKAPPPDASPPAPRERDGSDHALPADIVKWKDEIGNLAVESLTSRIRQLEAENATLHAEVEAHLQAYKDRHDHSVSLMQELLASRAREDAMRDGHLKPLLRAIEEGDPQRELAVRVKDAIAALASQLGKEVG